MSTPQQNLERLLEDPELFRIAKAKVEDFQRDVDTVYHMAKAGSLDSAPKHFLTELYMFEPKYVGMDGQHWTAFHAALRYNGTKDVPRELLTEKNLLSDMNGCTGLWYLVEYGRLDELLGIEFSDAVRGEVGVDWYNKNLAFIESARRSKELLASDADSVHDIEIF